MPPFMRQEPFRGIPQGMSPQSLMSQGPFTGMPQGMNPQNFVQPMQGMGQGQQAPPQIDQRTGQMISPMHQQQAVESPLPADPMQRLKMEMLRDQASQARDREMLERSIQQKKVRDLVGQTGVVERGRGMLDPQSVMRESEMDPRSVVREQEMFRRMR